MSPRGRTASLPPADHTGPPRITADGLVVHHYNQLGRLKVYDFSQLPVATAMQRSLAALFAARCSPDVWATHITSHSHWKYVMRFATFLSSLEEQPDDLQDLTAPVMKRWRVSLSSAPAGCNTLNGVGKLLRSDARLQSGTVAEELAVKVRPAKSTTQSYSGDEFDRITVAARKMFRSALLRIEENGRHLDAWGGGAFAEESPEWILGEGLEILSRTGALPHTVGRSGSRNLKKRYARAMGGTSAQATWQRLFLTRLEVTALAVLMLAEFGWNLSVISELGVPRATPDTGEDGRPTYRITLRKGRRGPGHHHETRNVTDDGASSPGRLITQALSATRFARAAVEELAPGSNRLMVWRTGWLGPAATALDRHPDVGPFRFGVQNNEAQGWARANGFPQSPFRRGRRTVTAVDRREPAQHSQQTHDRDYVLVDDRIRQEAMDVIAAGAQDAADRAHKSVLVARLQNQPESADTETATADCAAFYESPYPAPDGCGASFLMCLGCANARVHPGHHPRLVHLHQALSNLRSVLPSSRWERDWRDAHDRLEDLKNKIGEGPWRQALDRVSETDRDLIDLLLTGRLDS